MKTQEILGIVQALLPATTQKGIVDGMDLINCSGGSLTAYNDKIAISYIAPEELEDQEFSVQAEDFVHVLNSIKDDNVQISIKDEEIKIKSEDVDAVLSNNKANTTEELLKALNYNDIKWADLPDDFITGLSLCSFSASTNVNDRQLLFCVCITQNSIIATDKHRIGVYKNKDWDVQPVLIPYYSVQNIKQFKPDSYSIQNGWIHFINKDDAILSCRVFYEEGAIEAFKEWSTIINDKFTGNVSIPKEVIDVLDNLIQFSDEVNTIDKNVVLEFKKENLFCKAEKETGKLIKKLKIPNSSLDCKLNFRALFLRDILKLTNNMAVSATAVLLKTDKFTHVLSQQYNKK